MIDIDYAPGVFAFWIVFVFVLPALYGMFLVDAFWKKNKEQAARAGSQGEDVFR